MFSVVFMIIGFYCLQMVITIPQIMTAIVLLSSMVVCDNEPEVVETVEDIDQQEQVLNQTYVLKSNEVK